MFFQSCSIYGPEAVLLSTFALQVDLVSDGEEPPQIPAKDYRLAFKVLRGAALHFFARTVRKNISIHLRLVAITMWP